MRHIRYLSHKSTVCERPDLLGSQFVTIDPAEDNSALVGPCRECDQLLFIHNQRETYNEARELVDAVKPHVLKHYGMWLVVVTSVFWLFMFATWYVLANGGK